MKRHMVFVLVCAAVAAGSVLLGSVYAQGITLSDWPKIRPLVLQEAQNDLEGVIDAFVSAINASPATKEDKEAMLSYVVNYLGLDKADLDADPLDREREEFVRKFMRQNTDNTETQIDNFINAIVWKSAGQ